jgi:hypothetical protein
LNPPAPAAPRDPARSAAIRGTELSGLALTCVLLGTLLLVLWRDHADKLAAGQRRAAAIAQGNDRVITLELRNLERALQGIATDARRLQRTVPDLAPSLREGIVADVFSRHAELVDVVLLDRRGAAVTRGAGDPSVGRPRRGG